MKTSFVFLFIVIMFFGIVGCPSSDDSSFTTVTTSTGTKPDTGSGNSSVDTLGNDTIGGDTIGGVQPAPVPEPATMLLLSAGVVGLAGFGRKKFKK